MRLSVIIPALNEASSIVRAARSAWTAGAAEVVVADGGSGDDTAALAKAENCQVVFSPCGRARQQNAGAQAANGDVLLFMHADAALSPSVGEQLAAALESETVVCGALRQQIEAPGAIYRCLERGNALRAGWLGLPYGDQAIFVRREAFFEVGSFPEVPLLEDLLLMQRLRRRSRPVLLPGPVHVSPRRWQRHGVARQTLRNWCILLRYACGASPQDLAAAYRRHDQP